MLKKQIKLQKWNPPKNYQYDLINVWAPQSIRQQHVVKLLLSNPQEVQKMASNPIYKEVHDNVLAKVKKSKSQLSKQKMFTPRFPKRMFYWYNFQALGYIVFMVPAYYFIKDRLFFQTIQKRRSIGLSDKFGIDYEDVQNYPKAALQILQERRRNDAYIQKKEKNIQNTQTLFKEFSETRAHDLKKARMEVGLKTSQ